MLRRAAAAAALLLLPRCSADAEPPAGGHNAASTTKTELIHGMLELIGFGKRSQHSATTVQVAVVGLGLTGSASLRAALEQLGYTVLHDGEIVQESDLFAALYTGWLTMQEFNVQLGKHGYNASFLYTPDYYNWAAQSEGVRVILTVRDRNNWAKSWKTVAPMIDVLRSSPFIWFQLTKKLMPLLMDLFKRVPTANNNKRYLDTTTLQAGYDAHIEAVQKAVPKERLLVFDVNEGWGPLCAFLELPVPSVPFPHINGYAIVLSTYRIFLIITWVWPLPLLVCGLYIWWQNRTNGRDPAKKQS